MHFGSLKLLIAAMLIAGCQSSDAEEDLITATLTPEDAKTSAIGVTGKQTPDDVAQSDHNESAGATPATKETAQTDKQVTVAKSDPSKLPDVMKVYKPPKAGTVYTWRNNWASMPPKVSYRVAGTVSFDGVNYVKMTSVDGLKEIVHAYYDVENFGLKGYRDASGKPILTYKTSEQRYKFPMKPGDRWVTAWKSYDHRKKQEFSGGGVVQVIAFEMLETPAGTFRTAKVKMPTPRDLPKGMMRYVWYSPDLGITVKEQIGNGAMNWTQILERVVRPAA